MAKRTSFEGFQKAEAELRDRLAGPFCVCTVDDPRVMPMPLLPLLGWWRSLRDALRAYGADSSSGAQPLRRRASAVLLHALGESGEHWAEARAALFDLRRHFKAEASLLEPHDAQRHAYSLVINELGPAVKAAIDYFENAPEFFRKQEYKDVFFIGRRYIGRNDDERSQWVIEVIKFWGAHAAFGSRRVRNVAASLSPSNYQRVLATLSNAAAYTDGRPRILNKDERCIAVANDYAKFLDEEKRRPLSRRGEGLLKVAERVFNRLSDKYDKRSDSTLRKWIASGRKIIQGGKDVY